MVKILCILLAVAAIASAQFEILEELNIEILGEFFDNFIEPCKNLTGASDLDVANMFALDSTANRTRASNCCLNCLLKQMSFLTTQMVDGVPVYGFHSDMFEKYARIGNIDEGIIDAVRNVADACAAVEAADECELAVSILECVGEEGLKQFKMYMETQNDNVE